MLRGLGTPERQANRNENWNKAIQNTNEVAEVKGQKEKNFHFPLNTSIVYISLFTFHPIELNVEIPSSGTLIFTSMQGINSYFRKDVICNNKVLVVGESSAERVRELGVQDVECFPSAKELVENAKFSPEELYFYLSGEECLPVIPNWFACNKNLQFTHLYNYYKRKIRPLGETKRMIQQQAPHWHEDWLVFCSPSGVNLLLEDGLKLKEIPKIAALGGTTADELRKNDIFPLVVGQGKLRCLLNEILTFNSKETS